MKVDKLIERTNALTGPDQKTDAAIHRALAGGAKDHWYDFHGVWITDSTTPPITDSLDAAVALVERVLPGWAKGFDGGPKTCIAFVDEHDHTDRMFGARYTARGPAPAIALILALLSVLKDKEAREDE